MISENGKQEEMMKTDCALDSSPFFDYIINGIRLKNTGKIRT